MTTIRLLDARRGLNRKCEELFGNAKIAEAIYRYLCDGIEECEDAEPEQRWIPCSEKLPELYKDVLVWYVDDYNIACLVQIDNIKYWHFETSEMDSHIENVDAWLPLPEPWKGGDEV